MGTTRLVSAEIIDYHMAPLASRKEFGLQMDSTEALSHTVEIYTSLAKCLKQEGLSVVARDGIEPPTPAFSGLDYFRAIMLIIKD